MQRKLSKFSMAVVFTLFAVGSASAAQTATGPVTVWSISQNPGFSLISVGGAGDGGTGSVLCSVDATSVFGAALMTSAASAAAQGSNVTLTCSDTGQAQQLQLTVGSD